MATCAVLLLSLGAAACGLGDDEPVEDAIHGLYDAFAAKDAQKACRSLTAERRREIAKHEPKAGGRSCAQVMSRALAASGDRVDAAGNARVTNVEINGDTARATISIEGWETRLGLARRGNEWRIDDFKLAGR